MTWTWRIIIMLSLAFPSCGNGDLATPAPPKTGAQFKAGAALISWKTEREVPLQNGEVDGPVGVDSFQQVDERMYILDGMGSKQAYIYHVSGELEGVVGGPGNGPGEYVYPGGFCLSNNRLHLISSGRRYLVYDEVGNFITGNQDVHPGGIGNKIHPGPEGTAYFTCYSRHVPQATIFQVDSNGQLLNRFSPPDPEFVQFWDKVAPMGNIIVTPDHIGQIFIHKYQIHIFSLTGEAKDVIRLASTIYNQPDYKKAHDMDKQKSRAQRAFMNAYTLVMGFFKVGDGFVTVLANTTLSRDIRYLEFWDAQYHGLGRRAVNANEQVVGAYENSLVFFDTERQILIFREPDL